MVMSLDLDVKILDVNVNGHFRIYAFIHVPTDRYTDSHWPSDTNVLRPNTLSLSKDDKDSVKGIH